MKVLLAGGGTAGHINPALAIAGEIKKNNRRAEILFAGTPNGMEADLVKKAGYDFAPIKVKGFQRSFSPKAVAKNINAVRCLATAGYRARSIIKRFSPDIVVGTGGYVSGPVLREAEKMGIKTLIHEQNAFPGVTNKLLAKKAARVMLAVEEAKKYIETSSPIDVVGNPIRESILLKTKQQARKELGIDNAPCILSFGGSLGATKVNEAAADIMQWHTNNCEVNHIHAYGKFGAEEFPQMLKARGVDIKNKRLDIRAYIDNMDTCLAAADIVVCRAGAITLSELEATGKPSVLIPSPYVAENHQYHNAMVLQNHNAAIVIEEKNYDKKRLIDFISQAISDKDKLRELSANAYKLAITDARERIYDIIMEEYKKA